MNKQEFIDRLRAALTGRISPELVQEHVNYYEDYINTQVRMGKSEGDVLGTLGNPRLIAKTIIETSGQNETGDYENAGYQSSGYQNTVYQNADYQTPIKKIRIPGWLWAIIVILILVLISCIIFSVLSFFAPVLVPIVVVVFLVKLFRDWLN